MDLREAFGPGRVISVVGAGGKKSTLYALANALERAIVTSTVRIPVFDEEVSELRVTENPQTAVRDAEAWPLGVVPARDEGRDRYVGYDRTTIDELVSATTVPVLIKADGARTRLLKAPNDDEPQVPGSTDILVPVASVRAVGKALHSEFVHRPERVAELTGLSEDDRIEPADVVTVLSHENGGLKGCPDDSRVVPLLNMVDDNELEATARTIAADLTRESRIDSVVLGRMNRGEVVDVIT